MQFQAYSVRCSVQAYSDGVLAGLGLRPREGLYVRRDGITKVITLNLDARSYAKFSTKPKDRVRRSKLVEMYGLHEGIERFAQGETA